MNYPHKIVKMANFTLYMKCVCSLVSDFSQPHDCNLPDSSVHGILQARILEWVAISFSGDPTDPGIEPAPLTSPELAGMFFTTEMDR